MSKETHKERSLRAIEVITSAKNEIKEIFADTPELQIRAINTLQRLANGFAHSAGIQMQFDATSGSGEVKTPQFLTHIAGVPITRKEVKKVADAKPTTDEEKELEGFLELAMDDFKVLEPEELMDSYNELVLRALAKKVGLNVTATEPAIIDVAFVENMKETMGGNSKRIKTIKCKKCIFRTRGAGFGGFGREVGIKQSV